MATLSPLDQLRDRIGETVGLYLEGYWERLKSSRPDEKLIRDPIFGFQRFRPYEVLIIDSPLFQRLRAILQTSVGYFVYPSSIHSRFEHSLNCLHLADKVMKALAENQIGPEQQIRFTISDSQQATVRLAALLHDVGHCIFSHGSEFYYRQFSELKTALRDSEFRDSKASPGEVINYCIITSKEFKNLLWEPIKKQCRDTFPIVDDIKLIEVAQMIIGLSPDRDPERRYQTEIVNGPIDVDKLDYLTRDGYFTGVNMPVDIDRLLPSLRIERYKNEESACEEKRLVIDHRGIAVVEQLLFGRMMLYDTVYHHHKVRAANSELQALLRSKASSSCWPTRSKRIDSAADLLEIDEYDFFGTTYEDTDVKASVRRLRYRELPERALVVAARGLVDQDSHTKWGLQWSEFTARNDAAAEKKSKKFLTKFLELTCAYANSVGASVTVDDISLDVPDPPSYGRLGQETLVRIVPGYIVPLRDLFPFEKVVTNYSKQYKYRSYVFAPERWKSHVAYGAFRAFGDLGIHLNDLGLILAHQDEGDCHKFLLKNGIDIPNWRDVYYVPDGV